jgi:hypothetical protein
MELREKLPLGKDVFCFGAMQRALGVMQRGDFLLL